METCEKDQDFLDNFIQTLDYFTDAVANQMFCVKSMDSTHIYYSEAFVKFLDITKDQIIGKITYLPLYNDINIEEIIINEDQSVILNRNSETILKVNYVKNKLQLYFCIKSAIINPTTNNVVGILVQGVNNNIVNIHQYLLKAKLKDNNNFKIPSLTKREKQVIFFFMSYFSSQEIANAISEIENIKISKSRIDSVFNEQLYIKFDVNSRQALYDKLQILKFDKMIPTETLSTTSKIIDSVNTY